MKQLSPSCGWPRRNPSLESLNALLRVFAEHQTRSVRIFVMDPITCERRNQSAFSPGHLGRYAEVSADCSLVWMAEGHARGVDSAAFTPDGLNVASAPGCKGIRSVPAIAQYAGQRPRAMRPVLLDLAPQWNDSCHKYDAQPSAMGTKLRVHQIAEAGCGHIRSCRVCRIIFARNALGSYPRGLGSLGGGGRCV